MENHEENCEKTWGIRRKTVRKKTWRNQKENCEKTWRNQKENCEKNMEESEGKLGESMGNQK